MPNGETLLQSTQLMLELTRGSLRIFLPTPPATNDCSTVWPQVVISATAAMKRRNILCDGRATTTPGPGTEQQKIGQVIGSSLLPGCFNPGCF